MKTEPHQPTTTVFLQSISLAMNQLKQELQHDYERAYPELSEVIHLVLEEEESKAWELTTFPHLILPDLVEAHIANLNLRPVETKHGDVFAPDHYDGIGHYQHAFAA